MGALVSDWEWYVSLQTVFGERYLVAERNTAACAAPAFERNSIMGIMGPNAGIVIPTCKSCWFKAK